MRVTLSGVAEQSMRSGNDDHGRHTLRLLGSHAQRHMTAEAVADNLDFIYTHGIEQPEHVLRNFCGAERRGRTRCITVAAKVRDD